MADPVSTSLASGQSSTAATTVSFTAQPAGTLLVLSVVGDDYRTTSGTGRPEGNGWTVTQSIGGSGQFHGSYMWHKIADGTETSVTYTIGSATKSVYALSAHTNIDTVTPLDNSSQQQTNSSAATYTTGSTSTTGGRRLGLAHLGASNSGGLFTTVDTWLNSYTGLSVGVTTATPGLAVGQGVLVFDGGSPTSSGASFQPNTTSAQARSGIQAVFRVAGSVAAGPPDVVMAPRALTYAY